MILTYVLTNTSPNLPPRANHKHGYLKGEKIRLIQVLWRLIKL
jgi:hypothetical protein